MQQQPGFRSQPFTLFRPFALEDLPQAYSWFGEMRTHHPVFYDEGTHLSLSTLNKSLSHSITYSTERSTMMAMNDSTPSYARDIRPLFREIDRESMKFAFDLWDYHDIRIHAKDILERLAEGTMPCDGEWPEERIAQFRRWVEAGTPA